MKNETILLRLKPKLEVILNETNFEVIDTGEIKNEGIYSYQSIKSIEYKKEKINWFITIWSYVFGIVTESGTGNQHKDKAHLKVNLNEKTLKISLFNIDTATIEILKSKLESKITSLQPTSQNT